MIPATQKIYLQAMEEGLLKTFIEAGGHCEHTYLRTTVLADTWECSLRARDAYLPQTVTLSDVWVIVDSEVYLASPAVAAASAITGKISGPKDGYVKIWRKHNESSTRSCI